MTRSFLSRGALFYHSLHPKTTLTPLVCEEIVCPAPGWRKARRHAINKTSRIAADSPTHIFLRGIIIKAHPSPAAIGHPSRDVGAAPDFGEVEAPFFDFLAWRAEQMASAKLSSQAQILRTRQHAPDRPNRGNGRCPWSDRGRPRSLRVGGKWMSKTCGGDLRQRLTILRAQVSEREIDGSGSGSGGTQAYRTQRDDARRHELVGLIDLDCRDGRDELLLGWQAAREERTRGPSD